MANFPQRVLDDIEEGKDFFLGLDSESNENIINGCTNCEVKNYYCLFKILRDLQYKVDADKYDSYAVILYYQMMLIIGGNVPLNDFYFFRVGEHVFVQTNAFYDGVFTQENGHLLITQGDQFENSVQWEINENNHLIVRVL